MKKIVYTLAATLSALRVMAQGTLLVDQQSFDLATAIANTSIAGIGQSFTPGFTSIDYVQFGVFDVSSGSTLFVNLRQNSMSGAIIGSTGIQSVPLNNGHVPTTFLFANSIALTPGTQYFLEPVIVANAFQINITISTPGSNPYPGGTALDGNVSAGFDLWFAEGVVVPEPSTWALFGLGGGALFAVRARRPRFGAGK